MFHFDFSYAELETLRAFIRQALAESGLELKEPKRDVVKDLRRLWRRNRTLIERLLGQIAAKHDLPQRKKEDVARLLQDLGNHQAAKGPPTQLSLVKYSKDHGAFTRDSRVHALLFRREVSGQRGHHAMRRFTNFPSEFRACRDDDLDLRAEWIGCAGDIITIAWVSDDNFLCGTTEHSDTHNQQYNKPGNLLLGSCRAGKVQAYPEHRIPRPVVAKGDNSSEAMRQSQDPWLYSSVVASDYDRIRDVAFTSGFDRTAKVWKVSGSSMKMVGEWRHGGNVNFVAAAKGRLGLVATASDVPTEAVRIYRLDGRDISSSPFRSYSCSRVTDADGNPVSTEKWAYFPATMQWGVSDGAKHLLLVGYSPRSRTGEDLDIPEDRLRTGELCLWDGVTGERWKITSTTTQNVFEVLWHPTQVSFIAATSPQGLEVDSGVRTQIRIFRLSDAEDHAFTPVKTLDCTAADINELTIM